MLKRTHLAIGLAAALYFLPYVTNKIWFVPIALIATMLPDIDSGFSWLGKKPIFKPVQMMTEHRGIFHTYTLCIIFTALLAFFYPVFALPFFVGYSFHLFTDSFTPQGIRPFWPFKKVSQGVIRSGGKTESTIFYVFLIIDLILVVTKIYSLF